MSYLEGNGLICETQHGFGKNRSCLTNLLDFFEAVALQVDSGEPVDVHILTLGRLLIGSRMKGCL